jgi:hypothetical protein
MEEHIAHSPPHLLAAALRADPEAGNLRFPVTPPSGTVPRFARILKPGTSGSP